MRQKRAKAYRKLMHLYSLSFGFRKPYQVLFDSEMCKSAVAHKIDLIKQLPLVLQGEVKPMITQCSIHELYMQGKDQQPAVDLAKLFERRKCNHREAIPGDDCLQSVVGETNKHRYVIATQSQPLRVKLRGIPGTPIVHINRSVIVLEPPSDATVKAKEEAEERALHAPGLELVQSSASASVEQPRRIRKGPKGPNPLSVKKKTANVLPPSKKLSESTKTKPNPNSYTNDVEAGTKRKRSPNHESVDDAPDGNAEGGESIRKRRRKRKSRAEVTTGAG